MLSPIQSKKFKNKIKFKKIKNKKKENWAPRINAFELWCWRRLLRVPWTARSNQSTLKEVNTEHSLEELMLKLKLLYFGHLIQRADSRQKTLMLGKIEGRRESGWQRIRWSNDITDSMDMSLSKLREMVKEKKTWGAAVYRVCRGGHDWATKQRHSVKLIFSPEKSA